MPMWSDMSLEEQREERMTDITESIAEWMQGNLTKAEVMEWLWDSDCLLDAPELTYDEQGRKTGRRQVGRFVETGKQKKNAETLLTYYANGDVEDITVIHRDENDEIVEQYTIHHYQDGRQPIRIEG